MSPVLPSDSSWPQSLNESPVHHVSIRQFLKIGLIGVAWNAKVIVRGLSIVVGSLIRFRTRSTDFSESRRISIAGVLSLGTQPSSLSAYHVNPTLSLPT